MKESTTDLTQVMAHGKSQHSQDGSKDNSSEQEVHHLALNRPADVKLPRPQQAKNGMVPRLTCMA